MDVQKMYWDDLVQLRFQLLYIETYSDASYKKDNAINIILAIASSSSIGAWVIWKEAAIVWGAIIAISQVINAVKDYLPYNSRKKYLNQLHSELAELLNEYEYKWLDVAEGELTARQINDLLFSLRKKKQKVHKKYLVSNHLPRCKKYMELADNRLKEYYHGYVDEEEIVAA